MNRYIPKRTGVKGKPMRRYGLTTDDRIERGANPVWRREGTSRDDAVSHARKAATHLQCDVVVVEEVEGMTNSTRISPDGPCPCIACR